MLDLRNLTFQLMRELETTEGMREEREHERYEIIMTYLSSIYHHFNVGELTEQGRVFTKETADPERIAELSKEAQRLGFYDMEHPHGSKKI